MPLIDELVRKGKVVASRVNQPTTPAAEKEEPGTSQPDCSVRRPAANAESWS